MEIDMEINKYLAVALVGISCGATMAWLALKKRSLGYPRNLFLKKDAFMIKEPSLSNCKDLKLVVIVRKDLKMTKGKGISQCCHATVKAVNKTLKHYPELHQRYQENGRPKAILKVEDQLEMEKIADNAVRLGLLVSPINDAGRTQIAPGALTAIGIGPGPVELLDKVTNGLLPY